MVDVEVVGMRKLDGDGNLKAFADVRVGGELVIKGFSVMNGKRGLFVSMPRKAGKDGRWFDVLVPTDETLKQEFEMKILEAYDKDAEHSGAN